MRRYFVLDKTTGKRQQIDAGKVDGFFRAVESVTGLDRAVAEPMLRGGPIDHPDYTFTSELVNPFQPAKVAIP